MSNNYEVPVTRGLLSLILAMKAARTFYSHESAMAEDLGLKKPEDYISRCRNLFFNHYHQEVAALGLRPNTITFDAILKVHISQDLMSMPFEDLPKKFVFDPWGDQGHGGIRAVRKSA